MLAVLTLGFSFLVGIGVGEGAATAAQNQTDNVIGVSIHLGIAIFTVLLLIVTDLYTSGAYRRFPQWLSNAVETVKNYFSRVETETISGIESVDKAIAIAGYGYNPRQDLFFSKIDAWQRNVGYCRLYDEAAAPLNMIIDCEPVYFEYGGRRWLIEFWKGQYALNAGCEIGVYSTDGPDLNIPGVFNGTFYNCASDEDMLILSFTLVRKGETLMRRRARHWWLTGFKLGEFAEPSELTMYLSVTLKDEKMRDAFLGGLKSAGYLESEIIVEENTVKLKFDKPRTPQPLTRIPDTDWIIQKKNKIICKKYQEITAPYDNFPDKIQAIQQKAPELLDEIINIGKTKKLYEIYDELVKYMND